MLQRVACAVQPPHVASSGLISQSVQHCQHRGNAYASAQENHRTLAGLEVEEEASAGRGHLPHVVDSRPGMQIRARYSVRLELDPDSVPGGCWRSRQRIGAKDWCVVAIR